VTAVLLAQPHINVMLTDRHSQTALHSICSIGWSREAFQDIELEVEEYRTIECASWLSVVKLLLSRKDGPALLGAEAKYGKRAVDLVRDCISYLCEYPPQVAELFEDSGRHTLSPAAEHGLARYWRIFLERSGGMDVVIVSKLHLVMLGLI
jgi:hypothetical protein